MTAEGKPGTAPDAPSTAPAKPRTAKPSWTARPRKSVQNNRTHRSPTNPNPTHPLVPAPPPLVPPPPTPYPATRRPGQMITWKPRRQTARSRRHHFHLILIAAGSQRFHLGLGGVVGGDGHSAGMGVLDEPFVGSWAVAAGLVTRWELRHNFVRVFPDVYVRRGCSLDARGRARAAAHWAKGDGVLIGCSAAAMHGTRWLDADQPAEIARAGHCRPPCGIRAVRSVVEPSECCEVDGFTVTTPARTAFDLGRRLPRERAVPILDALCAATGLEPGEVAILASKHPGARALKPLADNARRRRSGRRIPTRDPHTIAADRRRLTAPHNTIGDP